MTMTMTMTAPAAAAASIPSTAAPAAAVTTTTTSIPTAGCRYTESDLFAYFVRTIDEARGREGFLCDTAEIELGSMAVTPLGHEVCCRD